MLRSIAVIACLLSLGTVASAFAIECPRGKLAISVDEIAALPRDQIPAEFFEWITRAPADRVLYEGLVAGLPAATLEIPKASGNCFYANSLEDNPPLHMEVNIVENRPHSLFLHVAQFVGEHRLMYDTTLKLTAVNAHELKIDASRPAKLEANIVTCDNEPDADCTSHPVVIGTIGKVSVKLIQ